jgi:hypothetical protein
MASNVNDVPEWFNNQYLDQKFDIERDLSEDEVRDMWGFADGLLGYSAPTDPGPFESKLEEENWSPEINQFSGAVDNESLRYDYKGFEEKDPVDLGKRIAGHRKSRPTADESGTSSPARKNPNPQSSRSGTPHINVDRIEKQDELGPVNHTLREGDNYVELTLNGVVEALEPRKIEIRKYEDLKLEHLRDAYGEPFEDEVSDITRGEKTVNNEISIITYDDLGEEA